MALALGIILIAVALLHGAGSHRAARAIPTLNFLEVYGGAIGGIVIGLTLCGMALWRSSVSADEPGLALFDFGLIGTVIVSFPVAVVLGLWALLLLSGRATLTPRQESGSQ